MDGPRCTDRPGGRRGGMTATGGRREPTIPYHLSRRTSRPGPRLLADIAHLDVPGIHVLERGSTYLVLAPQPARRYGPGAAVVVAIAVTLAVLVASARSVELVALLPAALLPLVPLLLSDPPQLAIGAVPEGDEDDTVVTVSGEMWGALAVSLHSYLSALPPAAVPGPMPAMDAEDTATGV
jgi:hypothetical protein